MADYPFARLLDLARQDEARAGTALLAAQQRLEKSIAQKDLLITYRADYQLRLQGAQQQGLPVSVWRDFLQFITKLDTAIAQQEADITRCEQLQLAAQAQWLEKRQKVAAFTTLETRFIEKVRQAENKQEQKLQDEYASRLRPPAT